MAILIVAMGIALVWAFTQNAENETQTEELVEENEGLKLEVEDANDKLRKIKMELAEKTMEADDNSERIKELLDQLEGLQSRMNSAIGDKRQSDADKKKLEEMLDEANYLVETYRAKIKELEERNRQLTDAKTELEGNVDELEGDKEKLEKDVKERDEKIKEAAILKAADFKYIGYNWRGKENTGPYFKNRQVKTKLQICCNLLDNPVAESGKRELYFIVRKPSGNILQQMKTSSGYFRIDGKQTAFTTKASTNYNKKRTRVCAIYKFGEDDGKLGDGDYTVEVYDGGTKIGTDKFRVK